MKNAASFRITAFACFYFSFICLLPFFHTWSWYPAVTVLLILVFSMLAVHVKPVALRLLLSVFPFAPAVYAIWVPGDYIMAALCAIPAVMNAVVLTAGRDTPPLYRCRREFYVLVLICALLSIASFNPLIFGWPTFVYIGGCMISGILMLRAGRAGQVASFRWQAGNTGLFLLPVAASAIVGVGLMFGFDYLVKWLAQFFYDEGVEAVHTSPSPIYVDTVIRVDQSEMPVSTAVPLPLETNAPGTVINIRSKGFDWRWIAIGVILVAACAVLIYILTRSKDKNLSEQEKLDLSLERDVSSIPAFRRGDMSEDDFNRAKIRELYRRYLDYLRSRGVRILPSETTRDISGAAVSVTEDDTELRTIYRISRYEHETPVTDEDVKRAEEQYLRLISYRPEESSPEPADAPKTT